MQQATMQHHRYWLFGGGNIKLEEAGKAQEKEEVRMAGFTLNSNSNLIKVIF